jgi:hypothetical protein
MQHKSTAFHDVIINSTSQVLASRSTTHLNCYFISPVTALTGPYDGTARFGERQPDNFRPARLDSAQGVDLLFGRWKVNYGPRGANADAETSRR